MPLKKNLKLKKTNIIYKREYTLEFSNKKEIENMVPVIFFLEKKRLDLWE